MPLSKHAGIRLLLAVVVAAAPAWARQTAQPFGKGAYRADEPGLVKPKLVKQVSPNYPTVARNASVAGDVELEAVVTADGKVGDVRIVKSLDKRFGLDEEAIRVAKLWLFAPARKDGFPVPVIVTIVVQFRLRSGQIGRAAPPRIGAQGGTFTATVEPPRPLVSGPPDDEFVKGAHRSDAPGIDPPVVKKSVQPTYPRVSGDRRPSGVVELDVVVLADGTIGRMRVAKSLDKEVGVDGFDAAALTAAEQWLFEPGRKDGAAVPVVVKVTLAFQISQQPVAQLDGLRQSVAAPQKAPML
jgi:TonB family protein